MTSLTTWLGFLHIMGAALWTGAWAAMSASAATAVNAPTAAGLERVYATMRILGPAVIGPATVAVLVPGAWLIARPGGAEFTDTWVVLGLLGYLVATVLGVAGLGPASRVAGHALDEGDLSAAVVATRRWYRLAIVLTVVLVLTTADMSVRP